MSTSGARLLLECLKREGVNTIFGYPGGAVLPIYDALVDVPEIRHVLVRHEQGAIHAADGWARACGSPGVALATSGPGATNLLTGLATAMADSIPVVAITGQVPLNLLGTDAFQETDILGASLPFVKYSALVRRTEDIPATVREAFRHAVSGRPGPVLLDVPKDVASQQTDVTVSGHLPADRKPQVAVPDVSATIELLAGAKRPVLYVGGGCLRSGSSGILRELAIRTGIPVTTTLMALGVFDSGHPLFLGMPGMHGTRRANTALAECDVMIAVGARFDDRVTGNASRFSPHSKRIVIDADAAEFSKICRADVRLHGDAGAVLHALARGLTDADPSKYEAWRDELARHAMRAPVSGVPPDVTLRPEEVFDVFNRVLPPETLFVTDVGQHQMWAAQLLHHRKPGTFITSGGLGTMGYGLPAALGAKLASPATPVVAIVGDGGFQMTAQELSTLARYRVPVLVVVLDNQCLGMVRQWQQLFHGRRYNEIDLSDNPDFVALANAMGVDAATTRNADALETAVTRALQDGRPWLLHVPIFREQNVFPIVPPGQPATAMLDSEEN